MGVARAPEDDSALNDTLPYLHVLMGLVAGAGPLVQMNPQIRRRRTLDALKRIIIRESLNHPLVLIFEDLHWIDSETQVLLDLLVDSIATTRILLLVNYRPEYRHNWAGKSYYTQFSLARFTSSQARMYEGKPIPKSIAKYLSPSGEDTLNRGISVKDRRRSLCCRWARETDEPGNPKIF